MKLTRKELKVRRKRWIRVVVLTMTAVAPVIACSLTFAADPAASPNGDPDSVSQLLATIRSATGSGSDRVDDAALKLANSNNPDAKTALLNVLQSAGSPAGQVAVTRAIAQVVNPDPSYIPAIGDLLGMNRPVTEAAASALASYSDNSAAFQLLTNFINDVKKPFRTEVIAAMGSLTEQSSAEYLVALLSRPNQSDSIQKAAAAALGEMTGISTYGNNILQWQQWWATNRGKTSDQFRAQLLLNRARLFNLAKQRNALLANEASQLLEHDYNILPDGQKSTVLLSYLNNRAPDIRIVGLGIADAAFGNLSDTVRNRLVEMLSDPDDRVRFRAVGAQISINNHQALPALIKQAKVEPQSRIRAVLATALGRVEEPSAAATLLDLLRDPQPEVVTAAAKAMAGPFGEKLRRADPNEATVISERIRKLLLDHADQPGTDDFRAACLAALAALRDPVSFDIFMRFLRADETADVRRAAIVGLGNLGNTNADAVVASQLDDPDREIRLTAAEALGSIATVEQADQLHNKMMADTDDGVKNALWEAFRKLYPKESVSQLAGWADTFKSDKDPAKWLVTLQALSQMLKDPQAIAENQQAMADALVSVTPPQNVEAIKMLQKSLDYWQTSGNGKGDQLESLIRQLIDLQLEEGQYAKAAAFASKEIGINRYYQQTVGPEIRNQVEKLSNKNPAAADVLINEALKMSPSLVDQDIQQIKQFQSDLKQRAAQPPGP